MTNLIENGVYELPQEKASYPATGKQINFLTSFKNVTAKVTISQLAKRLEMADFQELLEAAKSGQVFSIEN